MNHPLLPPRTPGSSRSWLPVAMALGLCVGGLVLPDLASADAFELDKVKGRDVASKFEIDDEDPLKSIPTPEQRDSDPLEFSYYLQNMTARAQGAFEAKDWALAIKYYEALAKAVPMRAIAFSQLCQAYEAVGKFDAAIENCQRATSLGGARGVDGLRYVRLVLQHGALTSERVQDLDETLAHLRQQLKVDSDELDSRKLKEEVAQRIQLADATPEERKEMKRQFEEASERRGSALENIFKRIEMLNCQLAARLADAERLDACVQEMHRVGFSDADTLPFIWGRGLVLGDQELLGQILDGAKKLGVAPSLLASMQAQRTSGKIPKADLRLEPKEDDTHGVTPGSVQNGPPGSEPDVSGISVKPTAAAAGPGSFWLAGALGAGLLVVLGFLGWTGLRGKSSSRDKPEATDALPGRAGS